MLTRWTRLTASILLAVCDLSTSLQKPLGLLLPLEGDEGYTWARGELHVNHLPVIDAPVHITGDDMSIAQDFLHHCHVSQPIRPFYPGLQVNDGSHSRRT